jgi:hypothetical protein
VPRHVARLVTRLVAPLVVDYSASRRQFLDYFVFTARPGASARRAARRRRRLLRLAQVHRRLLRLHRAFGCLGTSRGSLSSSTTLPRAGSSSTTSSSPRVWVPRHVTRLIVVVDYSASRRLVVVVNYSASRRLVIDYFASAARPGASTRRAARHAAHRTARR